MFSFKIRKDVLKKDGTAAIRLQIYKSKLKFINLDISGDPEYWNEESERFEIFKSVKDPIKKQRNEDRKLLNEKLEKANLRAKMVLQKLEDAHADWTVFNFEDEFLNKSKKITLFEEFLQKHIDNLLLKKNIGNSRVYTNVHNSLKRFDANLKKRSILDVNVKYLESYDSYLRSGNLSQNTRWSYLGTIRAVWNLAINNKIVDSNAYPFGKYGFRIPSLLKTRKRHANVELLDAFKSIELKSKIHDFYRNIFLLIYYMHGIAIRDLALLTKKNIVKMSDGEYIVYKRVKLASKASSSILQIKITDEINELRQKVLNHRAAVDDYIFPIIKKPGLVDSELYFHILGINMGINTRLSFIAKKLGHEDFNLTTYVARHTVANNLKQNKIPLEVIQQILGHSSLLTTQIYVDNFDNEEINKAISVL